MNYFDQRVEKLEDTLRVNKSWFLPGMTLEQAYEAIRAVPVSPEHGIENPTHPQPGGMPNFWRGDTFIQIRLREIFEGYKIDHGERYSIGLMGQSSFERDFLLWHDEQLREELLWSLFSVEGTEGVSFASLESPYGGWSAPLIALESEGLIDRDRLLDEMLKALSRGFSAHHSRWFTKHYEDFNPSVEETSARQHLLITAMGSGVDSTISFAVKQLSRLPQLDEDGFVTVAAHALGAPKTAAVTALKMLEKISAHREDLTASVADAATTGLYHPHDDVVRRSAALLRTLGRGGLIDGARETLSPAMALELLGHRDTGEAPAVAVASIEAQPVTPWTDDNALFHTRELLVTDDAVSFTLLVAWLAESGPRALEILKPVFPERDRHDGTNTHWLLFNCGISPEEVEEANRLWSRDEPVRGSLLRVVDIVHGLAPTRTLLSTPTDTFGRVDNEEFARRLATYEHRDDLWADDAALAHLRLVDYQEDTTGLAPQQSVQAGCHHRLWALSEPCRSTCHWDLTWVRTAQGWQHQSTHHDAKLLRLTDSPFNAARVPAASAIVAPTCLDAYTHNRECDLDAGMMSRPRRQYPDIVEVLTWHPGAWSPHTARFLGKAMANSDAEVRTVAAELVATKLPSACDAFATAQQWAQCEDVILSRWAASLADTATLNPVFVRDLLTYLLPQMDRETRDIGKLIELYRNVRLQTGHVGVDKQMREWLEALTGTSKAAKAAQAIVKEA